MRRRIVGVSGFLCLLCLFGCGGGDDGGVIAPPAIDPTGEWQMTVTETSNTCWAPLPPDTHGVLLTLIGAQVDWQDEGDFCDATPDFSYANGQLTHPAETSDFIGSDGCQYRESFPAVVGLFSETSFVSGVAQHYELIAGSGCTDIAAPCDVQLSVTGSRCQGCYGGCTFTATAASGRRATPLSPRTIGGRR